MMRIAASLLALAVLPRDVAGKGMGMGMGKMGGRLTARMAPYPDSGSSVDGSVSVKFDNDGAMLLQMNVAGLPADMTNAGIHIHAGTSCATTDDPLGHYWDTEEFGEGAANDPWNTYNSDAGTRYTSNADGVSDSAVANMDSGIGYSGNAGRVVVLHDDSGTRIGCGVLVKEYDSLKSGDVDIYPGYAGSLSPSGTVEVEFYPDRTFEVSYDLKGLGADCMECGIHVHQGVTCAAAGGHWWITSKVVDLWFGVFGAAYDSDGNGKAKGSYVLSNGFSAGAFIDRAVVIHANDGTRIGCATLSAERRGKNAGLSSTSETEFLDSNAGTVAVISGGLVVVGAVFVAARKSRGSKSESAGEQSDYATIPLVA